MQPDLVTFATQFGMAGLIAWMWLTERRAALARERQLTEAHARLIEQHVALDALMKLIGDNTRAVAAVESGQRALAVLLERWMRVVSPPGSTGLDSAQSTEAGDLPQRAPRRYQSPT